MRFILIYILIAVSFGCAKATPNETKQASMNSNSGDNNSGPATIAEAKAFVENVNKEYSELGKKVARSGWVRQTYITEDTMALAALADEEALAFSSRIVEQSKRFNGLELDDKTARAMNLIKIQSTMPAPDDAEKRSELANIAVQMESMYGKGKYCDDDGNCSTLGDLERILATSRNYDELEEAWVGWRTVSPPMRPMYQRFAELTKEGANELGFPDLATLWKSGYDMDSDAFEQEAER